MTKKTTKEKKLYIIKYKKVKKNNDKIQPKDIRKTF